MAFLRAAFACILLFAAWSQARAAETFGEGAEGVLVLRGGQALSGKISRVGNSYLVEVGAGARIHVPASDVDLHCRSLVEAYHKKCEYLSADHAGGHLDLADWCVRQGLHRQAAERISAALAIDPEEPRIAVFERRLREALETVQALRKPTPQAAPLVAVDDLETVTRSVSALAVERFTSAVQPVLLNRCATAGCHGTTSKSSFKLLRPAAGEPITRRYTQRNLQAVLKTIDKETPEASPLLTVPRGPHGSAPAAVFGQRDERQFEQLVQWVRQVAVPFDARGADLAKIEKTPAPAVDTPAPRLSQKPVIPAPPGKTPPANTPPGSLKREAGGETPSVLKSAPAASGKPEAPKLGVTKPGAGKPEAGKPEAVDPFDPEEFNRRFRQPEKAPKP